MSKLKRSFFSKSKQCKEGGYQKKDWYSISLPMAKIKQMQNILEDMNVDT